MSDARKNLLDLLADLEQESESTVALSERIDQAVLDQSLGPVVLWAMATWKVECPQVQGMALHSLMFGHLACENRLGTSDVMH